MHESPGMIGSLRQTLHAYRVPLLVAVVGTALSISAFMRAAEKQTLDLKNDFLSLARLEASLIDDNMIVFSEKVHGTMSVAQVINGTPGPTLRRYTETVLKRVPFTALGWVSKTGEAQSFLSWHPAEEIPDVSLDELTQRAAMDVLLEERSARDVIFSHPFTIPQLDRNDYYIAMISTAPRYGTVFGLVSLSKLLSVSSLAHEKKATLYFFDGNQITHKAGYKSADAILQSTSQKALTAHVPFYKQHELESTANRWRVLFIPSQPYLVQVMGPLPWIGFGAGMLITFLLCLTFYLQRRQNIVITEKVDEQTQLIREGKERIELIVRSALDAIVIMDANGKITEWNERAEVVFGWSSEEAIGNILSETIIPHEYRAAHEVGIKHFLKSGEGPVLNKRIELNALHRKGHTFPIELSITAQRLRGQFYFTAFVRDISERRVAEAEKERLIHDLQRSNQELDDFAYIASHDLKEPLRGLHNHSRFLIEDNAEKLDKESVDRLNRLLYLTQRMEKLVNDLLYFSRLGRQELAIKETDMNDVVKDIEELLDTSLTERNGRIVVPERLPTIVCDKTRVTEALRNLITNALKYNDKTEKLVEVGYHDSWTHTNGEIIPHVFYVKDNGIGIALEFHNEVFRIFRRLQHKAAIGEEGTGVGLTFVKKIIERHGGKIWLESQPGNGTVFYFNLERKPL